VRPRLLSLNSFTTAASGRHCEQHVWTSMIVLHASEVAQWLQGCCGLAAVK
jgi:hypothetical protein